jgi:demethylmenaquinone methyltransferase/2-methoxy-6-polyprenyl-1,4-benzoquinol methylase|tara:strand:- start:176 stop:907 length:732 start_codon:yes stop_codon:yes gene_type:complete
MVKPYQNSSSSKKEQVTSMFDGIADNYDSLNRIISMGIDKSWRRKLVAMAANKKPEKIVDVATGTGDLAIALTSIPSASITGIDIAIEMLEIGKQKITQRKLERKINMIVGDAESLPLDDNTIDVVTVAFGVRNFGDLHKGLSEIYRILKPEGQLFVLETSVPKNLFFRIGYKAYSLLFLPLIGRLFSSDKKAYSYLSHSAAAFPCGEVFNNKLRNVGFTRVQDHPQTFGVVTIYKATKSKNV